MADSPAAGDTKTPTTRWWRWGKYPLPALVVLIAVATVAALGAYTVSTPIHGTSMEPTLRSGDRVGSWSMTGHPDVKRFDIVLTRFTPSGGEVVKRVIALPGDKVRIDKPGDRPGQVLLQPGGTGPWFEVRNPAWEHNWNTLASSCCTPEGRMTNRAATVTVPAGMVFLLGDNPATSEDSRMHGWAPENLIKSVVQWRILPVGRMGTITNDVRLIPAPAPGPAG